MVLSTGFASKEAVRIGGGKQNAPIKFNTLIRGE
jgi:hypothetical protein